MRVWTLICGPKHRSDSWAAGDSVAQQPEAQRVTYVVEAVAVAAELLEDGRHPRMGHQLPEIAAPMQRIVCCAEFRPPTSEPVRRPLPMSAVMKSSVNRAFIKY